MCAMTFSASNPRKYPFSLMRLVTASSLALAAVLWLPASGAMAEQKDQQPAGDKKQLCKDLYNIYDTNMDEYYDNKAGSKQRQVHYSTAQRALSDFRKQGCKQKDIK